MFAVVEFSKKNKQEFAAVPIKWIANNKCFWPENNEVLKNIQHHLQPDKSWKTFPCSIIDFHGNFFIIIIYRTQRNYMLKNTKKITAY